MYISKSKRPEENGVWVSQIRLKRPTAKQLKAARKLVDLHKAKSEDFDEKVS